MTSELLRGFYLGDVLIEPLRGQVTGPAGSAHLPPKAVEVLVCLARDPGQLVTRETLLHRVWGADGGSNEALSHAISDVRHALKDHHDDPTYIQTLPKRGYRLLVDPEPVTESTSSVIGGSEKGVRVSDIGLLENLKRRGVLETAIAYMVVGWLLIQVADIVFERLLLPGWAATFVTVLVIAGFPIALVLSWYLEFRDGRAILHKMSPVDARRRRFGRTYLSVLAALGIAAVAVYIYDRNIGLPSADVPEVRKLSYEPPPIVENSIAVLPFLSIDGSEETGIFANGLAEDVIVRLSRVPGLHVAARGDSHSLSPNSSSQQVRERLRVQLYLQGSVEVAGNEMRVAVQMIDAETGFHVLGRQFQKPRDAFFDVRDEITSLTVANVRVALPPEVQAAALNIEDDPSVDAYVLYRRGIDTARGPASIGSITAALGWFDAALEVDPEYAAAHAGRCATYVRGYTEVDDSSYIEKAQAACSTALALNPNLDIVHTALGDLYVSTGQYADAEAQYQRALRKDPSSVDALIGLGRTYQRMKRPEDAEASLRQAVNIHPGNADAFNTLGVFLFQTGRFAEAARQYEYVVALDPGDMRGLGNLASAYMLQGRFAESAEAFERVLALEPTKGAYSNLGLMKYYLGDFDAAIEHHERAVELQENDYLARINLADALWVAEQPQPARQQYEIAAQLADSALRVNPNDPLILMDLAWIRTALGQHERAAELIGRSKALAADDPYVHYIDGLMHTRLGDEKAALAAFSTAVDLGYSTRLLAGDPNIGSLRHDARFERMVSLAE
ncbi:MAG: tetratricopeptide repeat protein [Gammaproteobacteria bacterium]|nr:tetratricopeptide repeat protein [Gammaproteobacteria bacterium]NNF61243.1 tetratricopeptide repeat protein [Gammaproteobacteria bacterium]NNM20781.1 tetratricopeptide repeat protein [Gammaproteobacteria bacterium]